VVHEAVHCCLLRVSLLPTRGAMGWLGTVANRFHLEYFSSVFFLYFRSIFILSNVGDFKLV
jgi:hypothetical protein